MALVEHHHAIVQVYACFDGLLNLCLAGSGIDSIQLGCTSIDITAIGRTHGTLTVIYQSHVVHRFVCVRHIGECR